MAISNTTVLPDPVGAQTTMDLSVILIDQFTIATNYIIEFIVQLFTFLFYRT